MKVLLDKGKLVVDNFKIRFEGTPAVFISDNCGRELYVIVDSSRWEKNTYNDDGSRFEYIKNNNGWAERTFSSSGSIMTYRNSFGANIDYGDVTDNLAF